MKFIFALAFSLACFVSHLSAERAPAHIPVSGWSFDWDDNIFNMPTQIMLWDSRLHREVGVSTADWARLRGVLGKKGTPGEFLELQKGDKDSFRFFAETGAGNSFLADVRLALSQLGYLWKGPSWDSFVLATASPTSALRTSIITARGNSPEHIFAALEFLKAQGLIRFLPPRQNIFAVDFPGSPEKFRAVHHNPGPAKAEIMKFLLDELESVPLLAIAPPVLNREGTAAQPMHLWGFSDDDAQNIATAVNVLSQEVAAKKWPQVKITLFYTGIENRANPPRAVVLTPWGGIRNFTDEEKEEYRWSGPRLKNYLAGPDVFLPKPIERGKLLVDKSVAAGFEGIFPLDNQVPKQTSPFNTGLAIFEANTRLMRGSDLIIANMTPFRGPSMDVGTAFEIGFMTAQGKPVLGYSENRQTYFERVQEFKQVPGISPSSFREEPTLELALRRRGFQMEDSFEIALKKANTLQARYEILSACSENQAPSKLPDAVERLGRRICKGIPPGTTLDEKLVGLCSCDGIALDLTPHLGPSLDVAAAFAAGFMNALGKPILGYSDTDKLYATRVFDFFGLPNNEDVLGKSLVDKKGNSVESFGMVDNLMIAGAIEKSSGTAIGRNFEETVNRYFER